MERFEHFLPLVKADAEKRLIFARAVHEVPDKSGEIFDYASSRPNIEAWSNAKFSESNGLSKGNVRVMHTKTVAGKVTDLTFNDAEKAVDVVIKVVDDNEWKKVEEGCYTGLSIGGSYAKKWQDGNLTRYTARPTEISLVDSPCIPTARFFDLQKADGVVERILLKGVLRTFADLWAARPKSFSEVWLAKRYDNTKHPREHDGKFSSKGGEEAGRFIGGAAGAVGGYAIGRKHGQKIGSAVGSGAARGINAAQNKIKPVQGFLHTFSRSMDQSDRTRNWRNAGKALGATHGHTIGALALGAGGALAGSAIGALIDAAGRRRRAKKAGRLDVYERLNRNTSVLPTNRRQAIRGATSAAHAGRRISDAYDAASRLGLLKSDSLIDQIDRALRT